MKHCEICKVEVDTSNDICPLCYNKLIELEPKTTPELFESKPKEKVKKSKIIVAKIFVLLSILAICVCVFINYATEAVPWSLVVILGIFYLWVLVSHTIMSRSTPFKKIFLQLFSVSALLLVTNYIFSSNDWLVCYVFPGMSMLVAIILSFIVMCNKNRKKMLYSFFAIELILILVSALFLIIKLDTFKLLNQINIVFTAIIALAYLLFGWRIIKTEFIRKFHI